MTSTEVCPTKEIPCVVSDGNYGLTVRAYCTKRSLVAVHFDQTGRGRIVFLPARAMLRVMGPSSALPHGLEVRFQHRIYNVFEIDLVTRSIPVVEPARVNRRATVSCIQQDDDNDLRPT
jgi:hypothetical protein